MIDELLWSYIMLSGAVLITCVLILLLLMWLAKKLG
jgi:hypothetical protein